MTAVEVHSAFPPPTVRGTKPPLWLRLPTGLVMLVMAVGAAWAGIPLPIAAISVLVLYWLLTARILRTFVLVRGVPATPVTRRWLVNETGIQVSGGGSAVGWRWAAIAEVTETPEHYLFRQAGGPALWLPRDTLSAEQEASLREMLVRKGLA